MFRFRGHAAGLPAAVLIVLHRIAVSGGPTENGHRPAVNALFRSADALREYLTGALAAQSTGAGP